MNINIQKTLLALLAQEDTDGDKKITVEDKGSKTFILENENEKLIIDGTYALSNLLQELVLAQKEGKTTVEITPERIYEEPTQRISRMIREYYWDGLTRRMDEQGVNELIKDTKNAELHADFLRIYVPYNDFLAQEYYAKLAKNNPIEVEILPKEITPEYVLKINKKPGILSLKLEQKEGQIKAIPFVVPGGRFNEMYGWDSYFQNIGILLDGKTELAKSVVDNFQYEIENYGKILNANRSYYLTRTQPPFYTSMIAEVFAQTQDVEWLKSHLKTAIKEYKTVWMVQGKRLTENGLNRYYAEGIGIPPETEEGHFDSVMNAFAKKHNLPLQAFIKAYADRVIIDQALDDYFTHDRSVRESGHDTTNRLEKICADINPVELNCMLYQYEKDFAYFTQTYLENDFCGYKAEYWETKAEQRKTTMNQLMWNEEEGIYFDYNHTENQQHVYLSASCFFPLWAKVASKEQAEKMAKQALPKLTEKGGIAGCTEQARGVVSENRPQRQWDYPNGWAPHQMIIWKGLLNYDYSKQTTDLIKRWIGMITQNAKDYNGTIPEKYDVVDATHKVFAEYGNVGTDFEYITQEGFGWMNASYQYGLSILNQLKS